MSRTEAPELKLPVFEGPLELLLHLIEKNKIDIFDIPMKYILKEEPYRYL